MVKVNISEAIEEVKPFVEEISGLTANLDDYRLIVSSRLNFMRKEKGNIFSKYVQARNTCGMHYWENEFKRSWFKFPKKFPGNVQAIYTTVGHEIVHNIQFSNFRNMVTNNAFAKAHLELGEKNKYLAFKLLLEGDARNIENQLKEKYYPEAAYSTSQFWNRFLPEDYTEHYDNGSKLMKEKFGRDRNLINPLYEKSLEELVEIFELDNNKK